MCGQTPREKRRAGSRCLPALRPLKDLNEASPSEAAGPNRETMSAGHFEEPRQLKMQLRYINYAFTLLSLAPVLRRQPRSLRFHRLKADEDHVVTTNVTSPEFHHKHKVACFCFFFPADESRLSFRKTVFFLERVARKLRLTAPRLFPPRPPSSLGRRRDT